ncbi:hypothetical protein PF008_g4938 [Phytophthora fragariae]|uniref:Uncharacterized protein n=1 Tax=Phytophthora fragariae TaxID=53985 RepID=A0A6G0S9Z1_9STRA|nr:hypothetical protein PF008_g4938 [Phytophthora fragariae]
MRMRIVCVFFYNQHRLVLEVQRVRAVLTNALYLEDQAVLIEGYLFYG